MRSIKFRVWDKILDRMDYNYETSCSGSEDFPINEIGKDENIILMQFTGLLDKSEPCKEVYEGDIVDVYGKIIGNKYENPLVKGDSPIVIEGIGTKNWSKTEASGLARGLKYSE